MLKTKEHETTIREVVKKRNRNKEVLRIYQTIKAMVRTRKRTRMENELMEGDLIDNDGDQTKKPKFLTKQYKL